MKFVGRHLDGFIALVLGWLVFLVLFFNGPSIGFTRDEGYYFSAAEHYAGWFRRLGADPKQALTEPVIRQHFEVNREHPVLVKNLMAIAYLSFGPGKDPDAGRWAVPGGGWYARVMRLPAQLFSALGVALLFLFGRSVASRRVGLFAALAFILAPRHFHHAHLACFDMPVTVCWLATVMAYRKSKGSLGWAIATGALWGCAIAVKHNAFFLAPVLVLHWLLTEGKLISLSRQGIGLPRIPMAFVSMLILGPAIFVLHWPFLWHKTLERIGWYLGFHWHHVNYPWEYFGTLLVNPPFPWLYSFAVTALVLPLPTLILAATGFFGVLGERLGHPLRGAFRAIARAKGWRPGSETGSDGQWVDRSDGWLLLLNAFIPTFLLALPWVPVFGGMKHWMNAMPFACLLAGLALDRMLTRLPQRLGGLQLTRSRIWSAAAPLVLLPSLLGLIHIGPYGLAFYNSLAGGIPGAADLGMQRQYWSNNVIGVLPWINQHLPRGAKLYLHEVNGDCFHTYQRDGYLRNDLRMVWLPEQADFTAYQYHREFVDVEYQIWNRLGEKKLAHGLYVDEVPMILVYDMSRRVR